MSKYRKLKKIDPIILDIDSDYDELNLIIRKYYIQYGENRLCLSEYYKDPDTVLPNIKINSN